MLKKRIIPKLLIKSEQIGLKKRPIVVTSKNFSGYRHVGDPISQAKIFQDQLADELLVINIDNKLTDGAKYWVQTDGQLLFSSNDCFENHFSHIKVAKGEIPNDSLKVVDLPMSAICNDCDQIEIFFSNNL